MNVEDKHAIAIKKALSDLDIKPKSRCTECWGRGYVRRMSWGSKKVHRLELCKCVAKNLTGFQWATVGRMVDEYIKKGEQNGVTSNN